MTKHEIVLMSITGEDKPGVTSSLTEILSKHNATILDIGQANIHQSLSLGILFRLDPDMQGNILKDLLFKSYELGVNAKFTPIKREEYDAWVSRQGKESFVITLLGQKIEANQLSQVTQVIAEQGLNIDTIKRLTGRIPLDSDNDSNDRSCIELSVRGTPQNLNLIHEKFVNLSGELDIDISFQKDNIYRRNRRLICFDMDSTLIKTEVIDELADRAGVGEEVRGITEAAMRGELDFNESFKKRVSLLKGLDESVMQEIADNLPIMDGADRLMHTLKNAVIKLQFFPEVLPILGIILKNDLVQIICMLTNSKLLTENLQENI